jgi:hypothetical protein
MPSLIQCGCLRKNSPGFSISRSSSHAWPLKFFECNGAPAATGSRVYWFAISTNGYRSTPFSMIYSSATGAQTDSAENVYVLSDSQEIFISAPRIVAQLRTRAFISSLVKVMLERQPITLR